MKKMVLGCAVIIVIALTLVGCESPNYVTDATLIQNVKIDKVATGSCGKGCTNYTITIFNGDTKLEYKSNQDLYYSIDKYLDALKTLNGNTNVTYDAIVSPSNEWVLGIAPTKNRQ